MKQNKVIKYHNKKMSLNSNVFANFSYMRVKNRVPFAKKNCTGLSHTFVFWGSLQVNWGVSLQKKVRGLLTQELPGNATMKSFQTFLETPKASMAIHPLGH